MSTLEQFAQLKLLTVEYLQRRRVSEAPGGGLIFDYGDSARARIRKSAQTAHPTLWATGDRRVMRIFGAILAEKFAQRSERTLLVVEGESDTLTAWFHKRPTMGVPGSTMVQLIQRDDIIWASRIVVVREPDAAGKTFVQSVAQRLREVGYEGEILEANLGPHKDISELHIAVEGDHERFSTALEGAITQASPVAVPNAASASSLGVLSDDNLLAQANVHIDWLVEGLLRESGIMVLSARPKVGKSELARNLAKAIATGGEFLGRRCRKGKVVWVGLEEPLSHLQERIEVHNLLGLGIQWVVQKPVGDEAVWLRRVVEHYRPDFIVIDTIGRLLRIDDVTDYSQVLRATQIMLDLRNQYNVSFCAIYHNSKAADKTLGSTQWEAFCDSIMLLSRGPDGERFVRTVQRSGTDMEAARLEHESDSGSITIAETRMMADQRAAEQKILRFASALGQPTTREELARKSGRLITVGRAAVDGLVTGGLLIPSGSGTRSDPRLYTVRKDPTNVSNATSNSSFSSEAIYIGEDSDDSDETAWRHSGETPMLSEDSEDSEDSEAGLLDYGKRVLGVVGEP